MFFFCSRTLFRTPRHIYLCFLGFLFAVTVSQTLLVFDNLEYFEDYRLGILWNVSKSGYIWYVRRVECVFNGIVVSELLTRSPSVAQMVKNLPVMWETWVRSLGWEDPLEEGMATHSSILAWRIPWTEEPGGLQSVGLQRVRQGWVTTHSIQPLANGERESSKQILMTLQLPIFPLQILWR